MYVIGLLPPSSLPLSSLSLALRLPSQSRESFFCPDTLFFTFDINANLSTSSQAAKVVKHIPNSQEQWRTSKDTANERIYITLLRTKFADSFRQICFPQSGFFHLFSCLLLCLSLNWV